MKKEITMWEHPYNLGTFGRNVKEYGLASSLKHDLDRTKKDLGNGLEFIVCTALYGVIIAAALIYGLYHKAIGEAIKEPFGEKKDKEKGILLSR